MYGVRHEYVQEFNEYQSTLSHLKHADPGFAKLLAEYDETDKKIYGIERQSLPVADSYIWELKKQRVMLKDQIYHILREQQG
jgi:uncharacterized protein YdcH (DUF465 family)